MRKVIETIFGSKIDNTRVVPVSVKIIIIFTLFILVSNLSSNYINLMFNRTELISLMKQLLVKDLKDIYSFCNNQFEIYKYNEDMDESIKNIENKGRSEFKKKKSIVLGIKPDSTLFFQASNIKKYKTFKDKEKMDFLNNKRKGKTEEGLISFMFNDEEYFGFYKYNQNWDIYIVRAEEYNEFYAESKRTFRNVSIIIIIITIISAVVGTYILRHILRFIGILTHEIMEMVGKQKLRVIDLKYAPNDEITYLGVAFNSLSSTIDNLLAIFRKFVNKDIAVKAYREREIRLEGQEKDLTVLFSDIKSFTYITETLGSDIIKLLNLHYTKAIHEIMTHDGIIGSIIGDALLAVYGALEDSSGNKSHQAILSAYKLQQVAKSLRINMKNTKDIILDEKGNLTPEEKMVYRAVLLQIGVGIDGGKVFYGNIGSYDRMTNTVIGDNVNSSSRLEGLTRIYNIPVICSEYVKDDIEENVENHGIQFYEIDTVQVKGKTIGKKIFWPLMKKYYGKNMDDEMGHFSDGLKYYYEGKWAEAYKNFEQCGLPLADVFKERTKGSTCPEDWNGIWEMKTK